MSLRTVLTSALTLFLALGPVSRSSAGNYRYDLVDPAWKAAGEDPRYRAPGLDKIQTIVVIYAENRSFDNIYGNFPGANGLANAKPPVYQQLDRDGTLLPKLPPVWGGLPGWPQAQTANLPNQPFAIDDPHGFAASGSVATRDLVHRFYNNQMQINNGNNDKYAAWADSGGLVMGFYGNGATASPMWPIAKKYVLADNFFQAAFGGSFLNHQYLICACAPLQANPNTDGAISAVEPDGVSLTLAAGSPASALAGVPKYVADSMLTPDLYAVNTVQPPYQPSGNAPVSGASGTQLLYANPGKASTLWPVRSPTIGDLLTNAGVNWAWYAGAWADALANPGHVYNKSVPNFQPHHQPFNYYQNFDPVANAANRAAHLLDGGLGGAKFIAGIDAGKLPPVTFYKPQGNLNEHPGYANVTDGDAHIADVISHLQKSPQWNNMVVIVTYDENGGFWDHATPPQGDRWGPGTRIPAIVVSPFAKAGTVDHSPYDTSSIVRLILKRFAGTAANPVYPGDLLPGLATRDNALKANGYRRPGDFTNALNLQ